MNSMDQKPIGRACRLLVWLRLTAGNASAPANYIGELSRFVGRLASIYGTAGAAGISGEGATTRPAAP